MTESSQPDPVRFRQVMGRYPTGVTVVTAMGAGGQPVGLTANSVTSVSLEPPLVLVCIAQDSESLGVIEASGAFAVNVLEASGEALARRFATVGQEERFDRVSYSLGDAGLPILDSALAWLECEIYRRFKAGDHIILVGLVTSAEASEGDPLLFHRGRYGHVAP